MAHAAIADRNRAVDKFFGEGLLSMTTEAQVSALGAQSETKLALMRVVTSHAITIRHRRVQIVLQHHVSLRLVTAKTQLILFSGERESVLLLV